MVTFDLNPAVSPLPIVPVRFVGPTAHRTIDTVLDTGSAECTLPISIARRLGLTVDTSDTPDGFVRGIAKVPKRFWRRTVEMRLADGNAGYAWTAKIAITDADIRLPALGWSGCLELFRSTFLGQPWRVTLEALPSFPGSRYKT